MKTAYGIILALALSGFAAAAPVRPAITAVSHLAVYSADMAKSDAFYTVKLGAVKRSNPEDAAGVRYYFNSRQFVEVLPLPANAAPKNRMAHTAYITANAEAMRVYLKASHIAVPRKLTVGADGSKWFEVADPEGNKVQFVELPKQLADVPVNPLSGHIIHIGMIAHDQALEDTFYRKLLGFRGYWAGGMHPEHPSWISQQVPDGRDWMEYMIVEGPEKTGIPAAMDQANAGVLNHFALGVGNMEKTVTILAGGERISAKSDGPKIGADGKWQFNMYDPDGTRAEFMEFHAVIKPCCTPFTASDPDE
jgi:catechol 2,3-dioxygenase-like lactoylglutathione lyase family enzyme